MRESAARVDVPQFLPPRLSQVQEDWMVPTRRYRRRDDIVERLASPAHRIRVVTRYWWPPRSEHLYAFAGEVLRWAAEMQSGDWIYWVHPLTHVPLTSEEAEQIIGLAAGPDLIERDELPDGAACLVIAGRVRSISTAVAVLWPLQVLMERQVLTDALGALGRAPAAVRHGLHFIEAPDASTDTARHDEAWRAVLNAVDAAHGACIGIYAGPRVESAAALVERINRRLATVASPVEAQWLTSVRAGALRTPRALFPGVQIDCSLDAGGSEDDGPYYSYRAYAALDFDLRRPAFVPTASGLTSWPRTTLGQRPAGWSPATVHARLANVLDRTIQLAYLAELERDRSKVTEWHHYHVYNWAPPPGDVIRLLAGESREIDRLADAIGTSRALTAREAMVRAVQIARAGAVSDPGRAREEQVAAHGYLAAGGRQELTADGEALIARLPDALGDTLEIGFGYGLTARRVAARAGRYVGIDLQTEQGQRLRECGGTGLVADIHWLPLAADTFDTVIADNVLEHAGDPLAVLAELARVLRKGGRIYALIPPDGVTSEYQIRTHFWKSDEWSLRAAAERTGFDVLTLEMLEYAMLGVYGCFPASRGRTCLLILERR